MKRKWWHDKVAYQIYPKSFYDSNDDGIGDIPGIIRKLDYLKDLGIDIIWLSPVYRSPMADQGYDIADYYDIDPRYGTMENMEELLAEAKKRNMHILMDLVVNHCSDEHEWFQKALADPEGEYGDYFYIRESENGELPCNWRSYFGGPVWEQIPGTNKYYFHSFHKKQPDLNWENPKVREAVYKNMNWWLDKGLSGFRIDAIINIKKALPFKNYPADREDGLCSLANMLEEADGIGTFLTEMKEYTFQKYDAFTVGEVMDEKPEDLPDFIGDGGYFSSIFNFSENSFGYSEKGWYAHTDITPEDYKYCCFESQERVENVGFLSNITENHDEPRGVSHYIPEGDCDDTSKKMLAAILLMRKGLPFIYQGQELGMENMVFSSVSEVDDISSLDEYQNARNAGLTEAEALKIINRFSRDHARTPFQWDDRVNAGFTSGTPWLQVNPNYTLINANAQIGMEDSLFSFYKGLIALRKHPDYKETIVYGDFVPVFEDQKNLMAFFRISKDKKLLIIANYQSSPQSVVIPGYKKLLLNNYPEIECHQNVLHLLGYQVVVIEI